MSSAPLRNHEAADATDARFSMRTLLKVTAAMAIIAAVSGPFVRRLDYEQQVSLSVVWGLWLVAAMCLIGYQAHQRLTAERLAGRPLVRLPMYHEYLPDLMRDGRNLYCLGVFALASLILAVMTVLTLTYSPARDLTIELNSYGMIAASGSVGLWLVSLGVRTLWWRKSIRFGETGILWDRRVMPWEYVVGAHWEDQIVLLIDGTDQCGAGIELHVRVPWQLRKTVERLLQDKSAAAPSRPPARSVPEGEGRKSAVLSPVKPQAHSRESFVSVFAVLVLFLLIGSGMPGTRQFAGMLMAGIFVSLAVWFWTRSLMAVRPGALRVRMAGRLGGGTALAWAAVAAGCWMLGYYYRFTSAAVTLATGFVYGMALAHVGAAFLVQEFDLRERGVVVPGRLVWPWADVRVVRWDRYGSGRLVLGRGWRRIVAVVPSEQRAAVEDVLQQKLGRIPANEVADEAR
jgi:hypothetical protein